MSRVLRIATRASELALRRTRAVQALLTARQIASEIVLSSRTVGDKRFDETIAPGGARDVFTRELEHAVARRKADCAIHSYADLSTDPHPDLALAAVLARDDPRDALVLNSMFEAASIAELPRGARVGSSSVRVRSLLRALFPDVEVVHLRGDLPTRLHKVDEGQVHATIVSASALHALAVSQRIAGFLEAPEWLPSPGQGAVVIQTRDDDHELRELLGPLDDPRTRLDTAAERALLAALEGGLQAPIGALVRDERPRALYAVMVDLEGRQLLRARMPMDDADPELVGVRVANELRGQGASRILDSIRGSERIPAPQPDP